MSKGKVSEEIARPLSVSEQTLAEPGAISDLTIGDFISRGGFSEERVIKLGGDPSKGQIPVYLGQFIGAGPDIELADDPRRKDGDDDGNKTLPTWMFHPVNPETREAIKNVTHSLISPHQVDVSCKKLAAIQQRNPNARIVAVFQWTGKTETRMGNQMNNVRCAHAILPDLAAAETAGKTETPATS